MSAYARLGTRIPLAVLTVTFLLLSPQAFAQWSQYQGDAAHTGYVNEAVARTNHTRIWERSFTTVMNRGPWPGVAANSQGVFQMVQTGTDYHYQDLVCLDSRTGSQRWSTPVYTSFGMVSAPSVDGSRVYVHSYGHSNVSGAPASYHPRLIGFDSLTGAVQYETGHDGQWGSGSRPTVLGGQVTALGGYYGGMDCYDAVTGARQWFIPFSQDGGPPPAMDENFAYVHFGLSSGAQFYAIDRQTGQVQYSILDATDTWGTAAYAPALGSQNDAIVAGNGYRKLTSFDLQQHTIRWTRQLDVVDAVAIADGAVFVPTKNWVSMLDEATGWDMWSWNAPVGVTLSSNVVLARNALFVASHTSLYAIDRASGATLWSEYLGDGGSNLEYTLALYDGVLYAAGYNRLIAFNVVPEPSGLLSCGFMVALACGGTMTGLRRRR